LAVATSMKRPRHPKREFEVVLKQAEGQGWSVSKTPRGLQDEVSLPR
jgi:hypothetical protein